MKKGEPINKKIVFGGIAAVLVVLVLAVFIGTRAGGDTKKLVEMGNWVRYDESRDMPLDLAFDSRTNEFYYCEDSEPYMGYDVYESYKFVTNNRIKLYSKHHKDTKYIKVISVDEDNLVINIDGEKQSFTNEAYNFDGLKIFSYSNCDKCKKLVADGEIGMDIRRVDGDTLHMAEFGEKTKLHDLKLAKDAKLYDIYIDESYDKNDELVHKCDVEEISSKDISKLIDVVYPYGIVWKNDKNEIEKLVIFRVSSDYKVSEE